MLKALAKDGIKILDTGDESISCPEAVKLLPGAMDSKVSIQDIQYLEPVPINEGMYEHEQNCEDDNTLVIDNTGLLDTNRIQEHEPEESTKLSNDTGDECINLKALAAEESTKLSNDTGAECIWPNYEDDLDDYTLVIEKTGSVDTDRIQQQKPHGDSIINMSFFLEEMH